MSWLPISGTPPQYSTAANALAGDYYIKFYASGTTTPINMATDSTGGTTLAKCALSAEGYPITNPLDDLTKFIPHIDQDYRIVMYLNETDADNNTTSSAAFNIDGMVLQVVPTGDAANITLRDVTIEQQDDYDRSPLFIDVTDFTAGAGPHVITVPTDWTPTDADMRFYRLDNSGIITPLTPSSTSSTTFTLAETLLSTDVIYIGDDNTRQNRYTSETYAGNVEKATAAEMIAETDDRFPDCKTVREYYGDIATTADMIAGTADKLPDCEIVREYYGETQFIALSAASLGGSFTAGTAYVYKVGRVVTISSGGLFHLSSTSASSAANSLPSWADALVTSNTTSDIGPTTVTRISTTAARQITANYREWTGATKSRAETGAFSISYISAS